MVQRELEMLSDTLKQAVYVSIPKSVGDLTADVEYAESCDVSTALKTYPIVVTIRYFGEVTDSTTPANRLYLIERDGNNVVETRGETERATLSISVFAAGNTHTARKNIDTYLSELLVWYMRDLPRIVQVSGRGGITDLSDIENTLRKDIDIFIRYRVTYPMTVPVVSSAQHTLNIQTRNL